MMSLRAYAALAVLMALSACGGGSSTAPSSTPTPTPTTFTLSGTVSDSSTGAGVSGASVTIQDGPNANRSATTDGSGHYSIAGLQQSGFTAKASATYYNALSKGIGLTSNQSLDFALAPIPQFSVSGSGDTVFDVPVRSMRVKIHGSYSGRCQNFILYIGSDLLVNEILGTCSIASGHTFDGTYLTNGGTGHTESSTGVNWTVTEVR